jgi:Ca2+-transporting ATPase
MRRSVPAARLADLARGLTGLTGDEARARLAGDGPNAILEAPPAPWRDLARDTGRDPMLWFLAAVGLVYAFIGQMRDAVVLLVAIVPLVGMDLFLHRRTQASTEGLRSRLAERAIVVRDGGEASVAALDLVPGDLVRVGPGQPFPADGIVVFGSDLQADESTLTGEAYPVVKVPLAEPPPFDGAAAVGGEHWTFAGTRLLTGQASVRVVFTGSETLYGEIVRSAIAGAHGRTPLQQAIQRLVGVLVAAAAAACALLAAMRVWQGHGWADALVSAVTLASAALPEEFPVVFTFFLGVGVYRLARRQALVRRAVSVENIGRVSCICSDKTGTMTEGRLDLTHLVPATGVTDNELLGLAALASRAESHDPLDVAIIGAGGTMAVSRTTCERVATFPFTESRRRETSLLSAGDAADTLVVTKGAFDTVITMTDAGDDEGASWSRRARALAEEGHKVIACAWQRRDVAPTAEPESGYRMAGLLAFEDRVRAGVAEAVAQCRAGGIHTIMLTGDHPLTARAVAREIGLGGAAPRVIDAEEMEALRARGDITGLRGVDVIARATPAQKLTLVRALQAAGEIVAVTGDGVNDVPALQAADVGIAMGERGTRGAREVAAIVLLDDNFRTIVRAVAEGRQLFENLRLSFAYLLMFHIPLVLTAALLPLVGFPLLYLPLHIVWLELIIHPTALLVFQELPGSDGGLGPARPRGDRGFFSTREWATIVVVGLLATVAVVVGYVRSVSEPGGVEHGRAMALAVLITAGAAITAGLSRLRTLTAWIVSIGGVASALVLIQTPRPAELLHLVPLRADDWAVTLGAGAVPGVLARLWLRADRR